MFRCKWFVSLWLALAPASSAQIIFEQGGDAPQTLADAQDLECSLENVSEIHGDLPTFTDVDVYHSIPSDTTALVVWNPDYAPNGAGGYFRTDLGLLLSNGSYEWSDSAISDNRAHLGVFIESGMSAYLAFGPDEMSLVGNPPVAFTSTGERHEVIEEYQLHQRVFGLPSWYQLDDTEDQLCVSDAELVPSVLESDGYRYYQDTGSTIDGWKPAVAALHIDLADIPDSLRSRFSIKVRTHVPSHYFLMLPDGTRLMDRDTGLDCNDPYITDNPFWCDEGPTLTYDELISLLPAGETEFVMFVGGGVAITGDDPPGCVQRAISGAANTRGVMVVMPILAFTSWAGQPEVASNGGNTLVRFSVRAENQIERYRVELLDATTGALLGPGESRALWRINGGGHTYQVTVPVEIPAGTQVRVRVTPHGRTTYYENQPIEADILETVTAVTVATEPTPTPSSILSVATPSPNPSRHRATARLTVPSPQPVRATIYNVLGREVRHVFEGMLAAGEHELRLNTLGLPAGVYILQVRGETGTAIQRFTVVR